MKIADEALSQVTLLQARIGAFSSLTLDTASSLLTAQDAYLSTSLSAIEGTDMVLETARLVQHQLLADNTMAALAIAANRNASSRILLQKIACGS